MKKILLVGLLAVSFAGAILWWHRSAREALLTIPATPNAAEASKTNSIQRGIPPIQSAAAVTNLAGAREMDPTANPYAAGLRGPGKSKRTWDPNFIDQYQQAKNGDPIRFELTDGSAAEGEIKIVQRTDGKVSYLSGELTAPEPGKFFFLTPPPGGKAGKAVGVIEFPVIKTAYRIEPTGLNGDPELWQRRLDEVLCLDMPKADPAAMMASTNAVENMPPLRPDMVPDYLPSYNVDDQGRPIISLQSYPGSPAVLLLDFFGGYTPTWGGITYNGPNVGNETIKDIWKRVAEDYMPFNINVTTDMKVYQAAPAASRQRCCFTFNGATTVGVAYFGSWNWGNDTPCWSAYCVGKPGAEVGAHEPGHTLGLSHQGQEIPNGTNAPTHNEYYAGQGSGATGWCPIMGAAYYDNVTSFAKGEYIYANNQQDELNTIATVNNNVTYRTDDTGSTLATSRFLEIYTNNTATAEGVIERTGDTDAFQFTTAGGNVSLMGKAVDDWADVALMATLADATDTIIASNNPQNTLSATITTNLPAGTYTFRVTGIGRNNPLTDGFSNYGSLGYYSITGVVAGARMPTRLSVVEHATNNTVIGAVGANNPNNDSLVYAIASGNNGGTFSIDDNGLVRVANNALLDFNNLATNTMYAVQFELFVNITDVNPPALTELNRRVVIAVQQLYPLVPTAVTAVPITSLRISLEWIGNPAATSYNVKRATAQGGPYTTIANAVNPAYVDAGLDGGVTYYYVISAVNANGESADSLEAKATSQSIPGFGFEIPNLGSGNYAYNPSDAFWAFSGLPGSGSGIAANGSGFSNPNAPEGTQVAFLQGYGVISQTLSGFSPGTTYTIIYSAAQRSGASQSGGESWNVSIDNNAIKSNAPGSASYATYTATFVASTGTHNLSFVGTDLIGGDNTVFIDNVRINPALHPVTPSVSLTSPSSGDVFVALATVNLAATVATNGNRIDGVQFYSDGGLVAAITNAPYTYTLVNIAAGAHNVFAKVLFNEGSSSDSAPVSYVVINRNSNFGFEAPSLGSGNYAYNVSGGSWTLNGSPGSGSGILANGSAFSNPNAPEGTQAGFVQGNGVISQILSGFVPGTNYTLTYMAAQRPGAGGSETWNVMIDNSVIQSNNPGGTVYGNYTVNFTATAATHKLAFVGTDFAENQDTVFLDKIAINPPISPPVLKLLPALSQDTLPATAGTVVGDAITFTAAFSNAPAARFQWQFIHAGVLSDIPGATNSSLSISNLQLADAGLYRLEAINVTNSQGISYSTASPLTISNLPPSVNNVITVFAAQTGLGGIRTNFVPTWTVVPGSLIAGRVPSAIGPGNFSMFGAGGVAVLTSGTFGSLNFWPGVGSSSTEVTCGSGAGQSLIYTLVGSANGFDLTNITVYGGWGDAGRDQQAYTVYYSTVSAPATFVPLSSVNYNPSNPTAVQSATRARLMAAHGMLATSVAKVKFDFTTPSGENGYSGYSEIQVFGIPTVIPPATNPTNITFQVVANGMNLSWPADHKGWHLQVQTNGLSSTWWDVSGSWSTNLISIPIESSVNSLFFRLISP